LTEFAAKAGRPAIENRGVARAPGRFFESVRPAWIRPERHFSKKAAARCGL